MGHSPDVDRPGSRSREPLHVTRAIQPHGALLSLDGSGMVMHLAGDTRRAVGVAPETLLGQHIGAVVDGDGRTLGIAAAQDALPGYVARWRPAPPGEGAWDVTAHASGVGIIVEFEPATAEHRSAAEGMAQLGRAVGALERPQELEELFRTAASEVRRLVGFDRVLVHRFVDDDCDFVVAESRGGALPSLLHDGLPGPDIPRSVRRRHERHRLRSIADTRHVPAPLHPAATADPAHALDMSGCCLRSVSPARLQYLRNMGVAASMSIPLVVDNVPWGVITCHHGQPRSVPYELREACGHVGRVFSRQIQRGEDIRHQRQRADLRKLRATWLDELRRTLDAGGRMELDPARLASLVPCDGVAVVSPGRVALAGRAPGEAEAIVLAGWLGEALRRGVFASHHLVGQLPAAASYAAHASGVLATRVDADEPTVLMWFRAEQAIRAEPAGHPHDADDGGISPAQPRAAFDGSRTARRQASRRWTRAETGAVRQVGRTLRGLFQQQALRDMKARLRDALAEHQSLAAQKNLLMQEVHHRVQNSLQIVNSMLQLQARQTTDPQVRAPFESAVNRLMAVGAVHRHLWRSSDAQHVLLGPYLKELCGDLTRSWGEGWSGHVTVQAPELAIKSQTAVTLALLVTELLTNAAKYAYAGAPGSVELVVGRADGVLRVAVRDHGIGMHGKVLGSGLGSKLIRIFTAQLGGTVQTVTGDEGTTITITVPLPSPVEPAGRDRKTTA